jgi:hypothetical protein
MEVLVSLVESPVLEQLTPVTKATILVDHGQGLAVKMEGGRAKNQPVRVSWIATDSEGEGKSTFQWSWMVTRIKVRRKREERGP